jgi:hypothetical protein
MARPARTRRRSGKPHRDLLPLALFALPLTVFMNAVRAALDLGALYRPQRKRAASSRS